MKNITKYGKNLDFCVKICYNINVFYKKREEYPFRKEKYNGK